jgi:hypothetical protein
MFGRRTDGTAIEDLSRLRAFMPFISPRRNESVVYYSTTVEVDAALAYMDLINRGRPEKRKVTLFQLYLRALAKALHERPGINRFVAGGRLWQRNHVAISFAAKQEILDGSPTVTIKRVFPENEGVEEMVDSILDTLVERRGGKQTSSDKEVNFALRFPVFLVRVVVGLLHQLNQWGLMPKAMMDDDPLFTSVFVANLGSVGLDSGYHHLWEWGTCSAFGVLGKIKPNAEGRQCIDIGYTYDERIEDGLYAAISLEEIKACLENPESLG